MKILEIYIQHIYYIQKLHESIDLYDGNIIHSEIHNHYPYHNIQNELIQIFASEIRTTIIKRITTIIKRIKEMKYFLVILNCTPNASNCEQMTLILPW